MYSFSRRFVFGFFPFLLLAPALHLHAQTAAGTIAGTVTDGSGAVIPGATVTITGATLSFFDNSANCRIQAEIRSKTFGLSNFGTPVSTVHSGADATDFAFAGGLLTKAFPAFTLAVPSNLIVWINATVAFNATGGGDCRYSGVLVDYTVSKP